MEGAAAELGDCSGACASCARSPPPIQALAAVAILTHTDVALRDNAVVTFHAHDACALHACAASHTRAPPRCPPPPPPPQASPTRFATPAHAPT